MGEYILGGNGDIKLTNYYTKEEIDNIIIDLESGEIDLTRYYTKEQIDDLLDNIETGNVDLTNYFTKTEVEEYVDTQTVGYVDMATLDTITDNKISNATLDLVEKEPFNNLTSKVNTLEDRVDNLSSVQITTMDVLPDTGETNIIYLVPKDGENPTNNTKDEYIWISEGESGRFELIGTTEIDLSNYYTKTQVDGALNGKVDKVDNKGLSTNDFIASEYYNRGEVDNLISNVEVDLTGYATETYVNDAIDNIDFPETDLSNYYDKTEVNNLIENVDVDLTGYATNAEINTKLEDYPTTSVVEGMIDEITAGDIDLAGYYNKEEVDTKLLLKVDNVEGKDLSSNDFTDSYKESLDGLSDALDSKADKIETNLEIERLDNKIDSNTTILAQKANQDTTYTKTEVDNIIPNLDGYATEDYVTNEIDSIDIPSIAGLVTEDNLNSALSEKIDNTYKAEVTTEINNAIIGLNIDDYAKIDLLGDKLDTTEFEAYKTNMVTSLSDLDGRINNLSSVQITTVDELPETGETNIIYLKPKDGENPTNNIKDEYIWILEGETGRFELIGTTEVDLSNYYTKSDANNAITAAITVLDLDNKLSSKAPVVHEHKISDITDLSSTLSNKVDKVEGKGLSTNDFVSANYLTKTEIETGLNNKVNKDGDKVLSTNDYTTAEKNKLENLDNTKDADKPISTATQAELELKANKADVAADILSSIAALNIEQYETTESVDSKLDNKVDTEAGKGLSTNDFVSTNYLTKTEVETRLESKADITDLTKASVGLSNVDDTSDADKPVSTATQAALNSKADSVHIHTISDIGGLQGALESKANQETTYTKDEVVNLIADNSGGGTSYIMITAGGPQTFGSEYENNIILTNSDTDITITIPDGNTNYIVRNINPQGRVFFTAGSGATIHASSTGLVDNDYVIAGYGMMSVIVYGTDIILTGGI